MFNEAIEFLMKSEHLKIVRFVLFDSYSFNAFEDELRNLFSAK